MKQKSCYRNSTDDQNEELLDIILLLLEHSGDELIGLNVS